MGCYLFQNTRVYALTRGQVACLSLEDFLRSSMPADTQAHILLAEADAGMLMAQVREVRQMFSARGIKTCVTYAAALRAFLNNRKYITADEGFLAVDDLGDRFLLTAAHGGQAPITRAIVTRDPLKIVDEIRRTQKSGPLLRILSNSREVMEALDPDRREKAMFFDVSFPAFEVLGKKRFAVELMAPEELVMRKQRDLRRGLVMAFIGTLLMAGAGAGAFYYARSMAVGREAQRMQLSREIKELEQQERELVRATYQDRLKSLPSVLFFDRLARFLMCLPADGRVESVDLQREPGMLWHLTALISFPGGEIFPFVCEDPLVQAAQVEHVFVQARPGIRVSHLVPAETGAGVRP